MLRELVSVMFCVAALPAIGGEAVCSSLASRAEAAQGGFYPPGEAKVTGEGKLSFFAAPSVKCKIRNLYVVPNDYLTVYKIYDGWALVMFVAKDVNDVVAWVPGDRLRITAQYGRNP